MKKSTVFTLVLAVLVMGPIGVGWVQSVLGLHWSSWHQKITLIVETPEGVKTASSVTAVSFSDSSRAGWLTPETQRVSTSVSGEAVVMDLGAGKYLFALLQDGSDAPRLFLPDIPREQAGPALAGLRKTIDLPRDAYPLLVTFENIADPASVKRVEPSQIALSFGDGYRLKAITMAITDEPVTEGRVDEVLTPAFFRLLGALYHDALARNGTKDSFFRTFAASLRRDAFTTQQPK